MKNLYKKYQLEWMLEHRYSMDDLMNEIQDTWNMLKEEVEEGEEVTIQEAYDYWKSYVGFNNEIWADYDEWMMNELSDFIEYVSDLLIAGLNEGIVEIISNPNDGQTVCGIEDDWFYFLNEELADMNPTKLLKTFSSEELVSMILPAMMDLDENLISHYISYIREILKDKRGSVYYEENDNNGI